MRREERRVITTVGCSLVVYSTKQSPLSLWEKSVREREGEERGGV